MPNHRPARARSTGPTQPKGAARSRRLSLVTAAMGALALLVAGLLYVHYRGAHEYPTNAGIVPGAPGSRADAAFAASSSSPSSTAGSPQARKPNQPHHTTPSRSPARAAVPLRLRIDDLKVDSAVVPVGVTNGALEVPENPRTLGWWTGGVRPGSRTGSVVIDGHVDSATRGLGALFHLATVRMGAHVIVKTSAGTVSYTIVARRVYSKRALPTSIFASGGLPRLVLITCGGPFDSSTRQYRDNVVVFGVPSV